MNSPSFFWGDSKENKCWKYISSQSSQFSLCLSVSAPLPFSFSTLSFLFQHSLFSVSALQRLPFSFCFVSAFFFYSMPSSVFQFCALPFSFSFSALFFFSSPALLFSFFLSKMCCPSLAQNVGLFSPKRLSFQPNLLFSA